MRHERTFAAMGTTVRIALDAPGDRVEALLDRAEALVTDLERRWSRFDPDSELSQLNAAAPHPTVVSLPTFDLLAVAVEAWSASRGAFDPTILPALERAGYDRPFAEGLDRPDRPTTSPVPGPDEILLDRPGRLVRLPAGCRVDLGGIAKGATADLVASELLVEGTTAVCVSVGGDLRVRTAPGAEPWPVGLSVAPRRPPVELLDGAVCTSSQRRRSWTSGSHRCHHLIDPATGTSFDGPVVEVAVVAGTALTAEFLTKVPFGLDLDAASEVLQAHGATALVLDEHGALHELGTLHSSLATPNLTPTPTRPEPAA